MYKIPTRLRPIAQCKSSYADPKSPPTILGPTRRRSPGAIRRQLSRLGGSRLSETNHLSLSSPRETLRPGKGIRGRGCSARWINSPWRPFSLVNKRGNASAGPRSPTGVLRSIHALDGYDSSPFSRFSSHGIYHVTDWGWQSSPVYPKVTFDSTESGKRVVRCIFDRWLAGAVRGNHPKKTINARSPTLASREVWAVPAHEVL